MTPQRIRLSRKAGWRLPLNAKSVARPHRWGNPFVVEGDMGFAPDGSDFWFPGGHGEAVAWAVESFRDDLIAGRLKVTVADAVNELRGRDLACFCPLPAPGEPDICHAFVLLEVANA